MNQTIDYGNLMRKAFSTVLSDLLMDVAKNGLPGAHHFYISFNTLHPDVELADSLSDRYPEEMTLVLQHEFSNLEVTNAGFSVTLYFGGKPEQIYVPFEAVQNFVDPSVEFGVSFNAYARDADDLDDDPTEAPMDVMAEPEDAPKKDAEIVSLDEFRK